MEKEPINIPKSLRSMRILTRGGKELILTHQRTKTYPGKNTYGEYGEKVHAMRRLTTYPTDRLSTTQLCISPEKDGETLGAMSYHAFGINDDAEVTCKRCLTILKNATRVTT